MTVIGNTEDLTYSTKDCRKVYFTVQLADNHFVDVMIVEKGTEECACIYIMQNEDGTTVYDNDGCTYNDFIYDDIEACNLAVAAFETEYGRKPRLFQ